LDEIPSPTLEVAEQDVAGPPPLVQVFELGISKIIPTEDHPSLEFFMKECYFENKYNFLTFFN
jgi:hypothetical protein